MYFSSFFPRIFFIVATSISFFFLNDTVLRSFNIFQFNIKKKKRKRKTWRRSSKKHLRIYQIIFFQIFVPSGRNNYVYSRENLNTTKESDNWSNEMDLFKVVDTLKRLKISVKWYSKWLNEGKKLSTDIEHLISEPRRKLGVGKSADSSYFSSTSPSTLRRKICLHWFCITRFLKVKM